MLKHYLLMREPRATGTGCGSKSEKEVLRKMPRMVVALADVIAPYGLTLI
jgi:hypothetical protein